MLADGWPLSCNVNHMHKSPPKLPRCQSVTTVRGSLQGTGSGSVDLDSMFGVEKNGSSATTNGTPISGNITLLMDSIERYLGIDQASLDRLKSETEESTAPWQD